MKRAQIASAHTPGPWTYRIAKRGRRAWIGGSGRPNLAYTSGEHYEANACLIVAAPNMYKALKAVFEDGVPSATTMDLVLAAIAEVEGKKQ